MKTTLIQLETHDDLISIRDRMDWAKTPRILLVWPPKGRVTVSPLDLALLCRHAAGLGAELGLVTRNFEIRAAAHKIGIACFWAAKDAQKKAWPVPQLQAAPRPRSHPLDLRAARTLVHQPDPLDIQADPRSRVGIFTLGVLALLAVMLVFIPSAEIRLTPPEQTQSLLISVSAAPDVQTAQLSGAVPIHSLKLTLDTTGTALATGQTFIPDKTAQGIARFTNQTLKPVTIPAKTILLTASNPPVVFLTVSEAEIPAGKGQVIEIPIQAQQPGASGNRPANAITAFEGPLGLLAQVTNPQPVTGGSDAPVPSATEQDRAYLRSRLLSDLERQARNQFAAQLAAGDVLLPSTFAQPQILEENLSPPPGQSGEKISLMLKVAYAVSCVSAQDLTRLATLVLDVSLSPGDLPVGGSLRYQQVSPPADFQGVIRWQIRAQRQVRPKISAGQVIPLVLGKSASGAANLLVETFGLAKSPQISIHPVWWPWLPFLPVQITVASG